MIIEILIIVVLCLIAVFSVIFAKYRKEKTEKMYDAARNIIRNDLLDESLKNPYLSTYVHKDLQGRKLMINFRILKSKPQKSYVFDPEQVIGIGRDKNLNKIALTGSFISLEHCRVYLNGDSAVLEDCFSANGTEVKRGMNTYSVKDGQSIVLEDKDTLIFGTVQMKIHLFVYDTIWM